MTLLLGRTDLTIFSLVLVVPLVIAAVVLLAGRNARVSGVAALGGGLSFSHLFLANLLVLVISVITLVSYSTRPLTYFILVSVSSGLILLQILVARPKYAGNLIIFQVCLLSLDLIWGLTLKYPLYFGDTDLLVHMNLIDAILKTGHVTTDYIAYQNYPLYHIFAATAVEITGLPVRTALFVVMGLAWQLGILFAFLIFRGLSSNPRVPLAGSLLFALSSQVIFYGSYSIARSLAFVFLMAWLYFALVKARTDIRYLFLSVIAMTAMIITHHLNVVYVIPVLVLVYACQVLVSRFRRDRLMDPLFIYLIAIGTFSYLVWVASSMANTQIREMLISLLTMDTGLKNATAMTNALGVAVVVGTIYYSFVLLLCLLGVRIMLDHIRPTGPRQPSGTFALAGLAGLVIYVPGFLALLPLSDIFLTDRLSLIAAPFVGFLMAYGVEYLYGLKKASRAVPDKKILLPAAVSGLVALGTFLSVISIGNAKDTTYFPQTAAVDSPYFTRAEMASFSFLSSRGDSALPVTADYPTARNAYTLSNFETREVLTTGEVSSVTGGYLVLRLAELQRKRALSFYPPAPERVVRYSIRYPLDLLLPEIAALEDSPSGDRIYSDGDVQVYLMR